MKVFYFTATGNSLYVAKQLSEEIYSIPQLLKKYDLGEEKLEFHDDVIGLVYPVYAWGAPRIVEEFINKSKLNAKYFFIVGTYGMTPGSSTTRVKKMLEEKGVVVSYINQIKMVDNYLPIYEQGKQISNEYKKNVETNLEKIKNDIYNRAIKNVNSNFIINFMSNKINKIFNEKEVNGFDKNFYVDDKCDGCGICSNVCPRKNIKIETKPVFNGNCEACLACINSCPKIAMHHKKEKSTVRYINQNIKLSEIIKSNKVL